MDNARQVRLFRNGRNQAVRIPKEFEMPGNEATIRKVGDQLILAPSKRRSLLAILATLPSLALGHSFPDVDHGLLPVDDPFADPPQPQ